MEPKEPKAPKDRRRKDWPIWFTLAAIPAGVVVVLLLTPTVRISEATCKKIKPGMTLAEAEAIIGASPGWHDGVEGSDPLGPELARENGPFWIGLNGEIQTWVDKGSGVIHTAGYVPIEVTQWSFAEFAFERITRRRWSELPYWWEL